MIIWIFDCKFYHRTFIQLSLLTLQFSENFNILECQARSIFLLLFSQEMKLTWNIVILKLHLKEINSLPNILKNFNIYRIEKSNTLSAKNKKPPGNIQPGKKAHNRRSFTMAVAIYSICHRNQRKLLDGVNQTVRLIIRRTLKSKVKG